MSEYTNIQDDEIDLIQILKFIWGKKNIISRFLILFGFLGVIIAVFSKKEFTANTIVMPQVSKGNKLGGLGGLAAIAGVTNVSGSDEGISPVLYPKVMASVPFRRALMSTPLKIEGIEKKVTYKEYYNQYYKPGVLSGIKKYTIGLPGLLLKSFRKGGSQKEELITQDSIYVVSSSEKQIFDLIGSQLSVDVISKEGIVKISYKMPEALASAQMVKASQALLQKTITDLKTQKIKEELDFVQTRHDEVKLDFIKKQGALASFKDKNQGLIMLRSQTRLERLQSDYNLSYGLYTELAKQLETQKIKLKENTPLFTTIEPVSVPTEKSKPRRLMILMIWLFLGLFFGLMVIFVKEFLKKFKQVDINTNNEL